MAGLSGLAWLATDQGDYTLAIDLLGQSIALARARHDESGRDMHCSIEPVPRWGVAGWWRVARTPQMPSIC